MSKDNAFSTEKFKTFFLNKNTAIIIVVVGIILVLFSGWLFPSGKQKKEKETSVSEETDIYSYIEKTEKGIALLVKGIEGAGECRVMVTLENSGEKVYATEDKSNENAVNDKNGNDSKVQKQTENETKITVIDGDSEQQPVIIKETNPQIRGVAVICAGGDNAAVQNKIIRMLSALLGIPANRIYVTK